MVAMVRERLSDARRSSHLAPLRAEHAGTPQGRCGCRGQTEQNRLLNYPRGRDEERSSWLPTPLPLSVKSKENFQVVRRIRNASAHAKKPLTFDHSLVHPGLGALSSRGGVIALVSRITSTSAAGSVTGAEHCGPMHT